MTAEMLNAARVFMGYDVAKVIAEHMGDYVEIWLQKAADEM